ncbi:MAG: hypothetical protein AAGH68_01350 [Pseudomonadota bacterium]
MSRTKLFRILPAAAAAFFTTQSDAFGHEAWLLTPMEVEELSRAPMPGVFTDPYVLGLGALAAGLGAMAALQIEHKHRRREERLTAPLAEITGGLAPVLVRAGLAVMMILGALGGLPREGTEPWTQPVLFVPDMQLTLLGGWDWLAPAQIILGTLLALGLATRAAAVGVIGLAVLGAFAFGGHFWAYAPHFAAPALILAVYGGGWLSVDRALALPPVPAIPDAARVHAWRVVLALVGGTFVYLGITYKLFQPTLLIAILDHGDFPTLGLPFELVALVMTGVEIVAGLLLAMGRLVRPVALFLIGAFSFFAVMLGETPLFHANLYATAAMLLMAGATAPRPLEPRTRAVLKLA